jgi:uncharacterized protein
MDKLSPVEALLRESSDPENPPAAEIIRLFERMRRIAVVGMSRDPLKPARRVPSYLAAKGYDVIPVNPNAERVLGRPAHRTLSDVHEAVDMVLVFRPSEMAGAFIEEAARRKEGPAIWLQEGIRADAQAARARARGILVVQDLCSYKVHRAIYT